MAEIKYHLTYPSRAELENATNGLGAHSGNVIAVIGGLEQGRNSWTVQAIAPITNERNSEVKRAKISLIYLTDYSRAISEAKAREIHPRLFRAVDKSK